MVTMVQHAPFWYLKFELTQRLCFSYRRLLINCLNGRCEPVWERHPSHPVRQRPGRQLQWHYSKRDVHTFPRVGNQLTHTHAHTTHTHTHTHTHARAHTHTQHNTRTHARTHAHLPPNQVGDLHVPAFCSPLPHPCLTLTLPPPHHHHHTHTHTHTHTQWARGGLGGGEGRKAMGLWVLNPDP